MSYIGLLTLTLVLALIITQTTPTLIEGASLALVTFVTEPDLFKGVTDFF